MEKEKELEEKQDKEYLRIAMELLHEIQVQSKRWALAFLVVVILWAATIGGFLWYLNQYDFTSTVEQTGLYIFNDSDVNVISSDITEEQMKEILKIINVKN